MTPAQLAVNAELHKTYISQVMNGRKKNIGIMNEHKIIEEGLGMTVSDFYKE